MVEGGERVPYSTLIFDSRGKAVSKGRKRGREKKSFQIYGSVYVLYSCAGWFSWVLLSSPLPLLLSLLLLKSLLLRKRQSPLLRCGDTLPPAFPNFVRLAAYILCVSTFFLPFPCKPNLIVPFLFLPLPAAEKGQNLCESVAAWSWNKNHIGWQKLDLVSVTAAALPPPLHRLFDGISNVVPPTFPQRELAFGKLWNISRGGSRKVGWGPFLCLISNFLPLQL